MNYFCYYFIMWLNWKKEQTRANQWERMKEENKGEFKFEHWSWDQGGGNETESEDEEAFCDFKLFPSLLHKDSLFLCLFLKLDSFKGWMQTGVPAAKEIICFRL